MRVPATAPIGTTSCCLWHGGAAGTGRVDDAVGVEFAVYADWDHGAPVDAAVVEQLCASFRPDDQTICIWVAQKLPNVLHISIDVDTDSDQDALRQGHLAVVEAAACANITGQAIKVTAYADDQHWTWVP